MNIHPKSIYSGKNLKIAANYSEPRKQVILLHLRLSACICVKLLKITEKLGYTVKKSTSSSELGKLNNKYKD
jgi:hypothetical protein